MIRPMTAAGRFLGRGRRPARALLHRARSAVRTLSQAKTVPLQITLDGHGVLNWRSTEAGVHALQLGTRRGGRRLEVTALDTSGPPHGLLRLDRLAPGSHLIRARTARGVQPVELLPAGDGTRNEARSSDLGTWYLEHGPAPRLVHRAASDEEPGILALDAAHGIVTLEVGPAHTSWALTLERRGGGRALPVAPRSGSTSGARIYRLGAAQWCEAELPTTGETTVWDVVLRGDGAPEERLRAAWRGSGLESPRVALRLRAVFSYAVPGRRIKIRPYWTKDDHLALELTSAPSIGGESA